MKKTWVSVFLFLLLAGAVGFSAGGTVYVYSGSFESTAPPAGSVCQPAGCGQSRFIRP